MIVNKPQFDVDSIKVGTAYYITKKTRHRYEIASACIVTGVKPLSINVSYYDEVMKGLQGITISINEVVDDVFTFEKLKIESVD